MPDVQFEEENLQAQASYQNFNPSSNEPKLVQFILKLGIVKDPKQANYVLIGIAVFAFLLTLYFIFGGGDAVPVGTFNTDPNTPIINPNIIRQ